MPKISLSGPADLLSVIPFHLGFHPRRSVVVVCLHGKRIGLVARFDLPADAHVEAAVAAHLATLVRDPPSAVWLVGFEDERGESEPLSRALLMALRGRKVDVEDRLVVRDGRWFVLDCDCCPVEGRLLPEAADVPAVAGYVALGHNVLADREALAALVAPLADDDPGHHDAEAAVDRWQARYTVCSAFDRLRARGLRADDTRQHDRSDEEGGRLGGWGLADDHSGWGIADDHSGWGLADDHSGWTPDDDVTDEINDDVEDDEAGSNPAARVSAVIDLAAARARLEPRAGGPAAGHRSTALVQLQAECFSAWGGVFRGEIAGEGLRSSLPALVGPLRDLQLRDALVAWLCPGSLPLGALPATLVALLESCVGAEVQAAAAGRGVLTDPAGQQRRGRRTRGPRPGQSEVGGSASDSSVWREWEEAGAPHLLQARLEAVCRITPASHAAPLLAVAGNVAWFHGDGARAGVALDTCLDLEPDHRLAGLIRRALDLGLRGGNDSRSTAGSDGQPHGESGFWNRPSSA
ncbi:MAG: DUF4192 domain-containing protein [Humibacillus sp.]